MSNIPDVRKDGPYCDKHLTGTGLAYVRGYDEAVNVIESFFANLDVYTDSLVIHYLEQHPEQADEIETAIRDWMEMQRNETVVAILDDQGTNQLGDGLQV